MTMKFYAPVLFPIIPNLFVYAKIEDGKVEYISFGTKLFSLPLNEVALHFIPKGIFFGRMFGCGSVTLNYAGRPYEIPNIVDGSTMIREIERLQKSDSAASAASIAEIETQIPRYTPRK